MRLYEFVLLALVLGTASSEIIEVCCQDTETTNCADLKITPQLIENALLALRAEFGNATITYSGTFSPTPFPTVGPTSVPTTSPGTETPTVDGDTSSPTVSPSTGFPTTSPTQNPSTVTPTASPITISPSKPPTQSPTTNSPATLSPQATESPTGSPTLLTSSPTKNPTDTTASPSANPTTTAPSRLPTVATLTPTRTITGRPTEVPSAHPSTSLPSVHPSTHPSTHPTAMPTDRPTSKPTPSPTNDPTPGPTAFGATPIPSVSPTTARPTPFPTQDPTARPTPFPTQLPTRTPTSQPTVQLFFFTRFTSKTDVLFDALITGTKGLILEAICKGITNSNLFSSCADTMVTDTYTENGMEVVIFKSTVTTKSTFTDDTPASVVFTDTTLLALYSPAEQTVAEITPPPTVVGVCADIIKTFYNKSAHNAIFSNFPNDEFVYAVPEFGAQGKDFQFITYAVELEFKCPDGKVLLWPNPTNKQAQLTCSESELNIVYPEGINAPVCGPSLEYSYTYSASSECSTYCGAGVKSRTATCVQTDLLTSVTVDTTMSNCANNMVPAATLTEPCDNRACPVPVLEVTSESPCPTTCADESTLTYGCKITTNQGEVQFLTDTDDACSHLAPRGTTTPCNRNIICGNFTYFREVVAVCSQTCGEAGVQGVQYVCREISTGIQANETECAHELKPSGNTTPCNIKECPTFEGGNYTDCSATCGIGQRSLVSPTRCIAPDSQTLYTFEACNEAESDYPQTQDCGVLPICPTIVPAYLEVSADVCSRTCGGGVYRTVAICVDTSKNNLGVTDAECVGAGLPKPPNRTVECNTRVCPSYEYIYGQYGACSYDSGTCGNGTQNRTRTCKVKFSGADAAATDCTSLTSLETTKVCSKDCDSRWTSSVYSNCPVSCGGGEQTRNVTCEAQAADVNQRCIPGDKPAQNRACNTNACPSNWDIGDFGLCSKTCGTGAQIRSVTCMINNAEVEPVFCPQTKPPTFQACSPIACPAYKSINGPCVGNCGLGTVHVTSTCQHGNGSVATGLCEGTPPLNSSSCSTGIECVDWTISESSRGCDRTCGGGTLLQVVTCPSQRCALSEQPLPAVDCNPETCGSAYYEVQEETDCKAQCKDDSEIATALYNPTYLCYYRGEQSDESICKEIIGPPKTEPLDCFKYCSVWDAPDFDESTCSDFCPGQFLDRLVSCVKNSAEEDCNSEYEPNSTFTCPQPTENCTANGSCGSTFACECTIGFGGPPDAPCTISPFLENVAIRDIAQYDDTGLPRETQIVVSYTFTGDKSGTLLVRALETRKGLETGVVYSLDPPGNTFYQANGDPIDVVLSTPPGGNYILELQAGERSTQAFGQSPEFTLASKCSLYSCGAHGRQNADCTGCDCLNSYLGERCEHEPCSQTKLCQNDGACTSNGVCSCPTKTEGRYCEVSRCHSCYNGGTPNCSTSDQCLCPGNFQGNDCSECKIDCRTGVDNTTCTCNDEILATAQTLVKVLSNDTTSAVYESQVLTFVQDYSRTGLTVMPNTVVFSDFTTTTTRVSFSLIATVNPTSPTSIRRRLLQSTRMSLRDQYVDAIESRQSLLRLGYMTGALDQESVELPSDAPTQKPTSLPTGRPSTQPTGEPTASPVTQSPTLTPTGAPSWYGTEAEGACEYSFTTMKCSTGFIHLRRALYGADSTRTCGDDTRLDFCPMQDVTTTIQQQCSDPGEDIVCRFLVDNTILGDHCPGKPKKLVLTYVCDVDGVQELPPGTEPNLPAVGEIRDFGPVCQLTQRLNVGCPTGSSVEFLEAKFGREPNKDFCQPPSGISPIVCEDDVSAYYNHQCMGRTVCDKKVGSGFFPGNNCYEGYLRGKYKCVAV